MVDPPRRLAAALAGVGAVLCVLGWYQISGQPTVAQQLPYLASATIPGAALLAVGLGLALRAPWSGGAAGSREAGSRQAWSRGVGPRGAGPHEVWSRGLGRRTGELAEAAPSGGSGLLRVPDGRYLHTPDCPLLDGRTDVIVAAESDLSTAESAAESGLPTAESAAESGLPTAESAAESGLPTAESAAESAQPAAESDLPAAESAAESAEPVTASGESPEPVTSSGKRAAESDAPPLRLCPLCHASAEGSTRR
jgi:hypothetical protein